MRILSLLIIVLYFPYFAFSQSEQGENKNIFENEIKLAIKNDPKGYLFKRYNTINSINSYYNILNRNEFSELELKKYLGDLYVLKYQFKISEDRGLLKPILIKSLAIDVPIGDNNYDNSFNYMLEYLKVMPEDSIFSDSFLPILKKWTNSYNYKSKAFQYFKNAPYLSPEHQYFRNKMLIDSYLKQWENYYLSDYCESNVDDIKNLMKNMDIETKIMAFVKLFEIERYLYKPLVEESYGLDNCRDSLLNVYTIKALQIDISKEDDYGKKFVKDLFSVVGLNYSMFFKENDVIFKSYDSPFSNQEIFMNNVAWVNYKNPKFIENALHLINKSIEIKENYTNTDTKAHILYYLKRYEEAALWAKKSLELCGECDVQANLIKFYEQIFAEK